MERIVEITGLNKSYRVENRELPVLDSLDLQVGTGEFISIIGPSGCGKSTLFRIIAGLDKDYAGTVRINRADIRIEKPRLAYMLQKDLLLSWRTVWQNITLPLELSGALKDTDTEYLKRMASEFGLLPFLKAWPDELSGGMRQRAALLRTWLMEGEVMLLDEPFGALDALTRYHMQDWLTEVWENHKKTVLFITHDIEEAIYLSDRVYVMSPRPGKLTGRFDTGFGRPRNREILYTEEFLRQKKELMSMLKEQTA